MASLLAFTDPPDHPTVDVGGNVAGPIVGLSADTLPEGAFTLGWRLDWVALDRLSDAELTALAEQDVDAHSVDRQIVPALSAAYGLSDDLTVGVRVPWVERDDVREPEVDGGVPGFASLGDSSGLGDVTVFGQYRLAQDEDERVEWAVLGGLKLDTGETHERADNGELFEAEMQPGSGSLDPLLGLAVTKRFDGSALSASVLYTYATEGTQDTDLGDVFGYNLAWSYRLTEPVRFEHEHADGSVHEHVDPVGLETDASTWDLLLELNGVNREKSDVDGEHDDNSGGHRLFLSPGVRVNVGGNWSAYASVGVPVLENLHGEEQETDWRATAGMTWGF